RHTRFSRDWSSDVCSSDLGAGVVLLHGEARDPQLGHLLADLRRHLPGEHVVAPAARLLGVADELGAEHVRVAAEDRGELLGEGRSEERRVGTEWRPGWSSD